MGLHGVSLFHLYNLVCVSFSSLLRYQEPGRRVDEDTPFSGNMQTPRGCPSGSGEETPAQAGWALCPLQRCPRAQREGEGKRFRGDRSWALRQRRECRRVMYERPA